MTERSGTDELSALRQGIDLLNMEILALLVKRGGLVRRIGDIAREGRAPLVQDPAREALMLEGLKRANPGPYPDEAIERIFKLIFQCSLELKQR